jgi:hypothetical protein
VIPAVAGEAQRTSLPRSPFMSDLKASNVGPFIAAPSLLNGDVKFP